MGEIIWCWNFLEGKVRECLGGERGGYSTFPYKMAQCYSQINVGQIFISNIWERAIINTLSANHLHVYTNK